MNQNVRMVEVKTLRQGQVIFREGDTESCMYCVRLGKVGIYDAYGEPGQKLLTELGSGGFFGEMGMVRGFPRSATAVAAAPDTEVEIITWDALSLILRDTPSKVIQIMQQLSTRLQDMSDKYIEACGVIAGLAEQQDASAGEGAEPALPRDADGFTPSLKNTRGGIHHGEPLRLKKYVDDYRRYGPSRRT